MKMIGLGEVLKGGPNLMKKIRDERRGRVQRLPEFPEFPEFPECEYRTCTGFSPPRASGPSGVRGPNGRNRTPKCIDPTVPKN